MSTANFKENTLFLGDNLEIMQGMNSECVDLIYLDPPFFTQRDWGDFDDRWKSIDDYISFLEIRCKEMHRILKNTGSFYLHCDPTASHYIKVMLDNLFGFDNFRNEIVWLRKHEQHNFATKQMTRQHDIIFYYSKTKKSKYNIQYLPYKEGYIDNDYKHEDKRGKYQTFPCTNESGGNKPYSFMGITRAWRFKKERMQQMYDDDMLTQATQTSPFRYKKYVDDAKGIRLSDLWIDIKPVRGTECTGYKTQKPLELLERIIKASSNEGDIVLDPFCGSGTTLVAAQRLGRKWVGIDLSATAITLAKKRMLQQVNLFDKNKPNIEHKAPSRTTD